MAMCIFLILLEFFFCHLDKRFFLVFLNVDLPEIDDTNKNIFSLKLDELFLYILLFLEIIFQISLPSIANILFEMLHALNAIWHFFDQFFASIHLQE